MEIRKWGRRLVAGVACLVMLGILVMGCSKTAGVDNTTEMPKKAKAKAAEMKDKNYGGG